MKHSQSMRIYVGLGAVVLCSMIASLVVSAESTLSQWVLAPALLALLGAVLQMFRDSSAHERTLELRYRDQFFDLSVTSHMAQVAFDKHVPFCEEYVAGVRKGVRELFREGPSKTALEVVAELENVRRKHEPWVPPEVLDRLQPFEKAVWSIGVGAVATDEPDAPNRTRRIREMYSTFSQVLGIPDEDADDLPEVRIDHVILGIQEALGISELHRLRTAIVKRAIEGIDETTQNTV